jgi:hypothetical protein
MRASTSPATTAESIGGCALRREAVNNLLPNTRNHSGIERCHLERREQSENNFLPNTGHYPGSCPSYRPEAPASPDTCIELLTGGL